MMSTRRGSHADLCILRIDPAVLDLPNVVISSQNASSDYVRFYSSPDGLTHLDKDLLYAESWLHADQIEEWRHKSIKCAEVLIPNKLDSVYIKGAYVSNETTKEQVQGLLEAAKLSLELTIQRNLFFQ
jgi:hypothetical protein